METTTDPDTQAMRRLLEETSTKVRATIEKAFPTLDDRLVVALSTACLDFAIDLQLMLLTKNRIHVDEAKVPRKMFEDLTDTLWDGYVERYRPKKSTEGVA